MSKDSPKKKHNTERVDGKKNTGRVTKNELAYRQNRMFQLIRNGGTRQDCIRFAEQQWGVAESTTDRYLKAVREMMNRDFDIDRAEFTAILMQQVSSIAMEARRTNQLNIALGAANTLARLANLDGA